MSREVEDVGPSGSNNLSRPPPETSDEYDEIAEHFFKLQSDITESATVEEPDWDYTPSPWGIVEWADPIPTADVPLDILYECAEDKYEKRKQNTQNGEAGWVYAPLDETTLGEEVAVDKRGRTGDFELVHYAGMASPQVRTDGDNVLSLLPEETLQLKIRAGDELVDVFLTIPPRDDYAESQLAKAIDAAGGAEWEITALNNTRLPVRRKESGRYYFDSRPEYERWKLEGRHLKWARGIGYKRKEYLKAAEAIATVPSLCVGAVGAWIIFRVLSTVPIPAEVDSLSPEFLVALIGYLLGIVLLVGIMGSVWHVGTQYLIEKVWDGGGFQGSSEEDITG